MSGAAERLRVLALLRADRRRHYHRPTVRNSTAPRLFAVLPVLTLLLCGCSQFERDWRSPALLKPPENNDPFVGRWKGYWKSVPSGHSGSLRSIVTKTDDDTCRAQFKASWALLLKFGYTAEMHVTQEGGVAHFTGEADLGKMAGGVYRYDGHADGTTFYCNYRSGADHGYFKLTRPK